MRRAFYLLLIALLIAFGLFFGTLNDQAARIDYFFFATEWPLALSLMGFLLVGVLLGGLFAFLAMWARTRRRVRALKRRAQQESSRSESQVPALTSDD